MRRLRAWLRMHGPEFGKRSEWAAWPTTVAPLSTPPLRFRPRQVIGGKRWSLTLYTAMEIEGKDSR